MAGWGDPPIPCTWIPSPWSSRRHFSFLADSSLEVSDYLASSQTCSLIGSYSLTIHRHSLTPLNRFDCCGAWSLFTSRGLVGNVKGWAMPKLQNFGSLLWLDMYSALGKRGVVHRYSTLIIYKWIDVLHVEVISYYQESVKGLKFGWLYNLSDRPLTFSRWVHGLITGLPFSHPHDGILGYSGTGYCKSNYTN